MTRVTPTCRSVVESYFVRAVGKYARYLRFTPSIFVETNTNSLSYGESWTIFVPTTPNPTSGFLILVPRPEVVELEMAVGDGMKMIISGGAVIPAWPPETRAAVVAP